MALKTITELKSKLSGGGARPNLFEVSIPSLPECASQRGKWKGDDNGAGKMQFLCKATALPASNIANIDVPFRGRILKVAGDRTIDTWTITVINDEDFVIRNHMEDWMNGISKLDNNTGATNPQSYMTDANVVQLGHGAGKGIKSVQNQDSGSTGGAQLATGLRKYKFIDIFPTNVSTIDLSYDSTDTIEEFTVEFQVQYWSALKGAAAFADVK